MEAPDEMSDVPETPVDGVAEAAQGAVDTQADTPASDRPVMPDGWTGEFDPHRAKATIERLREFERQVNNLSSDPDAAARFLAEKHGFEFADDEPDLEDTFEETGEDPYVRDIAELKAWKEQQEIERVEAAIANHVNELTADSDLTVEEKQWIFEQAKAPGFTEKRTEQIAKQFIDRMKQRDEAAIKRYLDSKKAPSPPPTGTSGEQQIDPFDSNARKARMAALLSAEEA